MTRGLIAVVLLSIALAGPSRAQVPQQVGHQGVIVLPGERVPLDGPLDLSFAIFDAPMGGTLRYQQTHSGVAVERGLYNVLLTDGAQSLDDAFGGPGPRFLEITIVAAPQEPELSGTKLEPRQYVAAVPYALRAGRARALLADEGAAVPRGGMILWDQATGCNGAARACPCGYDEAGEFRERTIRGADLQGAYADLADDPGTSLGDPDGAGKVGDRLLSAETPAHVHDMPNSTNHSHILSESDLAYFYGASQTAVGDHDDYQRGSVIGGGLTTQDGDHAHLMEPMSGGPHLHPFRTVLFCRRQ